MPFNVTEIMNLGFAVFVAIYLLTRLDDTLKSLNKTIQQLSQVVEATSSNGKETNELVCEQSRILKRQNQHLIDIKGEIGKVPKRGEFTREQFPDIT